MNYNSWTVAQNEGWELIANNLGHYCLRQLEDGQYEGGGSIYFQSEDETSVIEIELSHCVNKDVWLNGFADQYSEYFPY